MPPLIKGLSHGLKSTHRKGLVAHVPQAHGKDASPSGRRCPTAHRAVGFDCSSPPSGVPKKRRRNAPPLFWYALPYHPAERAVPTPDGFDGTYHPEGLENTPKRYAIVRTNQIMVDTCDWLVCYVQHGASNSRNLLEYAQRREAKGRIQIINIGESEVGME